ncbi:hypothetical protein MAIT1_02935 [Magnetofaba australis IT-1]|uniref:Uncharacterized protein n=1 Tax=Magnetofaba australis IT-1 TaxID=1434232 RepID=A0A1Y2K6B5_9PROT|nr:hypothetical protein MAIT1_02935 [Magnetofaba australis IT-1]
MRIVGPRRLFRRQVAQQGLLQTQRLSVVFVVVRVVVEHAVTLGLIQPDGADVIGAHLQPHPRRALPQRARLQGRQQALAQPLPAGVGGDRDGVDARQPRAASIEGQAVPKDGVTLCAVVGDVDQKLHMAMLQEVTKTATAESVAGETDVLQRCQGVEIGKDRRSDHGAYRGRNISGAALFIQEESDRASASRRCENRRRMRLLHAGFNTKIHMGIDPIKKRPANCAQDVFNMQCRQITALRW